MAINTISIYDRVRLQEYFKANVQRPGWRRWFRAIDSVPDELSVKIQGAPVKIGGLSKAFRSVTTSSRIRFATHYWLYPFEADVSLNKGLPYLLKEAGLDHLDKRQLVQAMLDECERIQRDHPALTNWVRARAALLAFENRQERPPDFRRAAVLLRNHLLRVVNFLWQDPETAVRLADDLVDRALRGAAQVVHAELGGDSTGTLNASLMLPTREPMALVSYMSSINLPAHQGKARADNIWNPLPRDPDMYLVVVAETVRHEHVGFWVPVVDGDGGARLPGAPEAFENHVGSCVFRHDLPSLKGFPEAVNARWRDHIQSRVRGRHFVSLPFLVQRSEGLGTVVPAVLNVNANPPEEQEWYRALHPVWLERARDAAAPFVEIAFYALQAKFAVLRGDELQPALDSLPAEWQVLPGAPVAFLEGDTDEQAEGVDRGSQEAGPEGAREDADSWSGRPRRG